LVAKKFATEHCLKEIASALR